jgi:hypothetical protein
MSMPLAQCFVLQSFNSNGFKILRHFECHVQQLVLDARLSMTVNGRVKSIVDLCQQILMVLPDGIFICLLSFHFMATFCKPKYMYSLF